MFVSAQAGLGGRWRWNDAAARLAEPDACRAGPLAPALENQSVAVFEKGALFSVAQANRLFAAGTEFQQRAGLRRGRPRLSAGAEQIAGDQIAAVDRVVRHEVPHRPI